MEPAIQEVEESFVFFFFKSQKPVLKFLSRILSRLNKEKIPRIPPVFLGEFIQEVLQKFPHHQVHHWEKAGRGLGAGGIPLVMFEHSCWVRLPKTNGILKPSESNEQKTDLHSRKLTSLARKSSISVPGLTTAPQMKDLPRAGRPTSTSTTASHDTTCQDELRFRRGCGSDAVHLSLQQK